MLKNMNEEIRKYPIYILKKGKLEPYHYIKSTNDYNHYEYNLHHFIEFKHYSKNEQWFKDRGIEQKLILLPISIHEQVHHQAIKNLSDSEFEKAYKISRWKLVFNKKYSVY